MVRSINRPCPSQVVGVLPVVRGHGAWEPWWWGQQQVPAHSTTVPSKGRRSSVPNNLPVCVCHKKAKARHCPCGAKVPSSKVVKARVGR